MGSTMARLRDSVVINLLNIAQTIVGKLIDLKLLMPHDPKLKKWFVFKSFDISKFAYNKSVYKKVPSVFKRFALRVAIKKLKRKIRMKTSRLLKRLTRFGIKFFELISRRTPWLRSLVRQREINGSLGITKPSPDEQLENNKRGPSYLGSLVSNDSPQFEEWVEGIFDQ